MSDKTVVWKITKNLKHYLRDSIGNAIDVTGRGSGNVDYVKWKIQQGYSREGICEELRYLDISDTAKDQRREGAEVECPADIIETMKNTSMTASVAKLGKLYRMGGILCAVAVTIQLILYLAGSKLLSFAGTNPVLLGILTAAIWFLAMGLIVTGYILPYRGRNIIKKEQDTVDEMLENLVCYRDIITEFRLDEEQLESEGVKSPKRLIVHMSTNYFEDVLCGVDSLSFFPTFEISKESEILLKAVEDTIIGRPVYVFKHVIDGNPHYSAYLGSKELFLDL